MIQTKTRIKDIISSTLNETIRSEVNFPSRHLEERKDDFAPFLYALPFCQAMPQVLPLFNVLCVYPNVAGNRIQMRT